MQKSFTSVKIWQAGRGIRKLDYTLGLDRINHLDKSKIKVFGMPDVIRHQPKALTKKKVKRDCLEVMTYSKSFEEVEKVRLFLKDKFGRDVVAVRHADQARIHAHFFIPWRGEEGRALHLSLADLKNIRFDVAGLLGQEVTPTGQGRRSLHRLEYVRDPARAKETIRLMGEKPMMPDAGIEEDIPTPEEAGIEKKEEEDIPASLPEEAEIIEEISPTQVPARDEISDPGPSSQAKMQAKQAKIEEEIKNARELALEDVRQGIAERFRGGLNHRGREVPAHSLNAYRNEYRAGIARAEAKDIGNGLVDIKKPKLPDWIEKAMKKDKTIEEIEGERLDKERKEVLERAREQGLKQDKWIWYDRPGR